MNKEYAEYTKSFYKFLHVLLKYRMANIRYENPCLIMDVDGVLLSERSSNFSDIPLPGAIEFVEFCEEKNIPIYIITNRRVFSEKNLTDLGFSKFANVYYNENSENTKLFKFRKRHEISKNHEIIFCIGDKLHDIDSERDEHGEPILIMNPY